jgi:hypothetical protein
MSATTEVPLTIQPDAAARVAELGLQREFDEMIEQARRMIPDLRRIEVTLAWPPDYEDDPRVIIAPIVPNRGVSYLPAEQQYVAWELATYSPDVLRHILLMIGYEEVNER